MVEEWYIIVEEFDELLQAILGKINKKYHLIISKDFSARIGKGKCNKSGKVNIIWVESVKSGYY